MCNPNKQRYVKICPRIQQTYCSYSSDSCNNCHYFKIFDEEFLMFAITLNERVPLDTTIFKKLF